jgi:hypothetical protein
MTEKCEITDFCPVCKIYSRLSSSELGRHLVNAKKEILLAIKTMIEREIERTEKTGSSEQAKKVDINYSEPDAG